MSKLLVIACPRCGLCHHSDKHICSRCHTPLPPPADYVSIQPYTEETCSFYRSIFGEELLLLSPHFLEIASMTWTVRTLWEHLHSVHHAEYGRGTGSYLRLSQPGELFWDGTLPYPYHPDIIPLGLFGFTSVSPLASDLRRFAPQLQWYPK